MSREGVFPGVRLGFEVGEWNVYIMKIHAGMPMESDIETIGSTTWPNANEKWFQNPLAANEIFFHNTLAPIRNHWHKFSSWKRWQSQKKQVRIHWLIFSNSVGSTNGKPLAHTLSQKSLAIHQFIVESYGTHSVCSWHATTKHPGTPRCEQVWFWVHGDMGGTTRAVLQRDSSRFIMS